MSSSGTAPIARQPQFRAITASSCPRGHPSLFPPLGFRSRVEWGLRKRGLNRPNRQIAQCSASRNRTAAASADVRHRKGHLGRPLGIVGRTPTFTKAVLAAGPSGLGQHRRIKHFHISYALARSHSRPALGVAGAHRAVLHRGPVGDAAERIRPPARRPRLARAHL